MGFASKLEAAGLGEGLGCGLGVGQAGRSCESRQVAGFDSRSGLWVRIRGGWVVQGCPLVSVIVIVPFMVTILNHCPAAAVSC